MSLLKQWTKGEGVWGIWRLDESERELRDLLPAKPYYDEELALLKSSSRRLEYLGARVLLNTLCGKEPRILHSPSGKPYLEAEATHISISHTRGYIAVVIHPTWNVGIDIEQYGEKVKRVASRFIRTDEIPNRTLLSERELLYYYLLHWSARETLFKLLDLSEIDFLKHFYIHPFVLSQNGTCMGEEYRTEQNKHFQISYMLHDDFVCTWAVEDCL